MVAPVARLRSAVPSALAESASRALRRWVPPPVRDRFTGGRHPSSSPPPLPDPSWVGGPPDFVGIGVQRAGTTWWYGLLATHPRIDRPSHLPKELHYFDKLAERRVRDTGVLERYGEFFPRRPGNLSGEWTPGYIADFWAPPLLRAAAPRAKLLAILRDPIERYRSGIVHNRAEGHVWGPFSAELAFARGLYHRQLLRVLDHFPREQVLVLQYEACLRDPWTELKRTFAFLGVDPEVEPPEESTTRRVNHNPPKGELPEHVRESLWEAYEGEVLRLARDFPEIDLELWPNFRHLHSTPPRSRPGE